MAYRNTIISLASVVALGTACSKAPTYDQNVQSGSTQQAQQQTASDDATNGNTQTTTTSETENKPTTEQQKPAETTTAATPPAADKPAAAGTVDTALKADPVKQMANNTLFNVVNVTNAKGWGTTPTAAIKAPVAVDAAGALIKPDTTVVRQTVVVLNPADPNMLFTADGKTQLKPAAMTSLMVICNKTTTAIELHSGLGAAAFAHGTGGIAANTCAAYPAQNLTQATFDATKVNATYDHIAGNNAANNVYITMQKISPTGTIVP